MDFSYLEFENRFRGQSSEVKKEQEKYLPYFAGRRVVLDIGCGRGEFLELLRAQGVSEAYGIEINEEMIKHCREKGLRVVKQDALTHLKGLADGSLEGVFISHVVEHLPPADMLAMISLVHRKLGTGQYLLAETLNPQCLFSMGPYFMDFSHVFPVHPLTFSFVLESQGFHGIEFLYRQYLPPEFLTLDPIPADALTGTPFEEAYNNTVTKLQVILDQVFKNFIYTIAGIK